MINHIYPLNDIKEHQMSSTCDCEPRLEIQPNGDFKCIHNSWDGRECIQQEPED